MTRTKKPLKIDYCKVEEQYNPELLDFENAENIGISISEFTHWRLLKGYKQRKRKDVKIEKIEFYNLYEKGLSDREIARKLKTCAQNVYLYRCMHGIPTNHPSTHKDPESLFYNKEFVEHIISRKHKRERYS